MIFFDFALMLGFQALILLYNIFYHYSKLLAKIFTSYYRKLCHLAASASGVLFFQWSQIDSSLFRKKWLVKIFPLFYFLCASVTGFCGEIWTNVALAEGRSPRSQCIKKGTGFNFCHRVALQSSSSGFHSLAKQKNSRKTKFEKLRAIKKNLWPQHFFQFRSFWLVSFKIASEHREQGKMFFTFFPIP